jgi:hypothetical protein
MDCPASFNKGSSSTIIVFCQPATGKDYLVESKSRGKIDQKKSPKPKKTPFRFRSLAADYDSYCPNISAQQNRILNMAMADKDTDATAGAGTDDFNENEIESSGSSLRTTRRRRGVGAPPQTQTFKNDNSSSLSTSLGRHSSRLCTVASSPTPNTNLLSDGGGVSSASAAAGEIVNGGRGRRSGRMAVPASTKFNNKDNIEIMEEEMEFEDVVKVPSQTTTMKKRKRSTKSSTTVEGQSENHDCDHATNMVDKTSEIVANHKRRPLILLGEKPRGMYECDYCGSDITRAPRIRCADCPDFDLCLDCFAVDDHHHMAKYKREEEAQRRKDAAKLAGLELPEVELMASSSSSAGVVGGGRKGSRLGGSKIMNSNKDKVTEKDGDEELGSYVGGIWVPYFRHTPDHRYIVADSTRYVMFPSFRGVRAMIAESVDITQSSENTVADNGNGDCVSVETYEETKQNNLLDRKDNEILAPANEAESFGPKEEQCQHQSKVLSSSSMNVDEAVNEDENALAEVPVENEMSGTESMKDTERKKLKNEKMEISLDDEHEITKAAKIPPSDIDSQATVSNTIIKVKEAEIANGDAPDISDRTIVYEPKSQPRIFIITDDAKNSWTAEEDLCLLDGIITCGLGNWPDIAEHVNGTNNGEGSSSIANGDGGSSRIKTDKQCMERYLDDFMGRYGYILPPYTMVPESQEDLGIDKEDDAEQQASGTLAPCSYGESAGLETISRKRPRRSVSSSSILGTEDWAPGFKSIKFRAVPTEELGEYTGLWPHPYIPSIEGAKMGDEVGRDLWYRSEQYFIRQTASAATSDEAEAFRKEFTERRTQNLPGYEAKVLPPRLEDMKQLPGSQLAGYMPRRGEFDMEWDNDAEKTISEMEFTSDDTEADRELKLDVLRIFNAKLDEREKRKRFIIDRGLLNYRENQEKLWQMAPDERQLVQRMRIFARYQTQEEHETFVDKIIEAKRLRKEISKLQMYRRMGMTSLADAEKYEMDKSRRELHRSAWMKKEEEKRKAAEEAARVAKEHSSSLGIALPTSSQGTSTSSEFSEASNAETNQSLQVWRQFKKSKQVYRSEGEGETKSAKFILKDKPGFELLTKKEVGLCKRLLLLPQNYLDVKKALISESIAQGIWNPTEGGVQKQNRSLVKVDVTQHDSIVDFVLESGWIPHRPSLNS